MKAVNEGLSDSFLGVLFLSAMIMLSYGDFLPYVFIIVSLFLVLAVIHKKSRYLLVSLLAFLAGFYLYAFVREVFHRLIDSLPLAVLLDRLMLSVIILSLIITAALFRKNISLHVKRPKWDELIYFPYIPHGFHSIKTSRFLTFSMLGTAAAFIPLLFLFGDWEQMKRLAVFAFLFSLVNAFLEEVLWRGALFHILSDAKSLPYAVIMTSLAFGLHHIAIGIPFAASLAFSIGGVFYALITVRSGSIFPSFVWHFLINIFMVFCGFIISY